MKHYGDVSKINGSEIEPVDIITFGSPCQDMSVAGKRAGIQDGERSNLFFQAIRIIKEMREETDGQYPKYAVWENVPGAFSSNKGYDFLAVLEALCSICDSTVSIPKPYDAKRADRLVWNGAGEIVGDNYSVAWRTLDAQYWGVPQRRKRIYLVADFTGRRAGEILFKPDSLRGNLSQGNEAGQGVTADAVGGVDGSSGVVGIDGYNFSITGDKSATVGVNCGMSTGRNGVIESVDGSSGNGGQLAATVISSYGTKWNGNAGAYNGENFVLQKPGIDGSAGVECLAVDGYNQTVSDVCGSIRAGKSDQDHVGCIVLNDQGGSSINVEQEETSPTLRANSHQANGIDRADTAGCNGCGWRENESYTLNTIDRHAVCYPLNEQIILRHGALGKNTGFGAGEDGDPAYTLQANHPHAVCYQDQVGALQARDYKGVGNQYVGENKLVVEKKRKYIIRRLTPTECARLQGFPDWWSALAPYNPADAEFWEDVRKTHAEINGKKYKPVKDIKKWYNKLHNDGAEYKMWGNGIALPNAEYVIHGIAEQGAKTLGSLFDGSGGFPLAGTMNGIKPLWASEVEPYPIAVTKSRFKEVHNGK